MSPLQLGLLVIAVIAVAAVYLYNAFEERRVQRRMDGAFQKPEDVLLAPRVGQGERREPGMSEGGDEGEVVVSISREAKAGKPEEPPPPAQAPDSLVVEIIDIPAVPDEPEAREITAAPMASETGAAGCEPDTAIESLACYSFGEPVAAKELLGVFPEELRGKTSWYGRRETDGAWRLLDTQSEVACREITAGLLLANRQGPASRAQLRSFLDSANELARALGATLMLPELSAEVARADALDQACSVVDVQVGLTLLRREAAMLAGTRLRGVAEAAGFRLNGRGGFDYLHEEGGRLMFEMVDVGGRPLTTENLKSSQLSGITLLLDVPRIQEPLRAFDQMKAVARRLGITLEASLVDDARRPLADSALAAIRTQLQQACAAMRDMDVEPGGARALRLFS